MFGLFKPKPVVDAASWDCISAYYSGLDADKKRIQDRRAAESVMSYWKMKQAKK